MTKNYSQMLLTRKPCNGGLNVAYQGFLTDSDGVAWAPAI